jgi:hypothetical protein
VVFKWAEIMQRICDEAHEKNYGTDWKNTHPINALFAHKVYDMVNRHSSLSYDGVFHDAYKACMEVIDAKETV